MKRALAAVALWLALTNLSPAQTNPPPVHQLAAADCQRSPAEVNDPHASARPEVPTLDMAAMDAQLKSMHELHAKMMHAKTRKERQALMGEHMRHMGALMAQMSTEHGIAPCDMPLREREMMKRMEVMQSMMQMMIDCMADREMK